MQKYNDFNDFNMVVMDAKAEGEEEGIRWGILQQKEKDDKIIAQKDDYIKQLYDCITQRDNCIKQRDDYIKQLEAKLQSYGDKYAKV